MAELGVNGLPPDPFPELPRPKIAVVARDWAGVILFDFIAAVVLVMSAATVNKFAAGFAFLASLLIIYVLRVRRRVPNSPGRNACAVIAGIGFVVLLVGVGYGTSRAYLALFGHQGAALVVGQRRTTERGGGISYHCTVRLPDGYSSALTASSDECEGQWPDPDPAFGSHIPVVYDPSHVIDPMAGTKRQLGVFKTVAPATSGLALVLLAASMAVTRTARANSGD